MNDREYRKMFELESIYWWFLVRRRLIEEVVSRLSPAPESKEPGTSRPGNAGFRILDAGCGTGANLEMLNLHGEAIGVDLSSRALRLSSRRPTGPLMAGNLESLGFGAASFDLITALDVLEHLELDSLAIKELHRVTKPGGWVIITAPAYEFLWSEHDEALHHCRRYCRTDLARKVTAAGFHIETITYFMALPLVPILLFRVARRLVTKQPYQAKASYVLLPRPLNRILAAFVGLERRLLSRVRLPFGVSLLCVARKPIERCDSAGAVRQRNDSPAPVQDIMRHRAA